MDCNKSNTTSNVIILELSPHLASKYYTNMFPTSVGKDPCAWCGLIPPITAIIDMVIGFQQFCGNPIIVQNQWLQEREKNPV